MAEFARLQALIEAPADQVWQVLSDFEHPQRLANSIEQCVANGAGVGAVRVVTVRGISIHERLESFDQGRYQLSYRALATGEMPSPHIKSYLATVVLRLLKPELTEIEWWSEGELTGSAKIVQNHFTSLYARAVDAIVADLADHKKNDGSRF